MQLQQAREYLDGDGNGGCRVVEYAALDKQKEGG